ncbi:MAG: ImmA/IrrE family metallo-endopeptidase [Anaerovoracaceae bacterium]
MTKFCDKKPDFGRCQETATDLLYKQDLSVVFLNVQRLNYDKVIKFDTFENYFLYSGKPSVEFNKKALRDGCTLKKYGVNIILYNSDSYSFERLNWTLAHEVGHIYLDHTKDEALEEVEAHFFTAQLFMPEYTLHEAAYKYGNGRLTTEDIMSLFSVSYESACKRISTMNRKGFWSACKKDREIWEAQEEKISIYFDCKKKGENFLEAYNYIQVCKHEMRLDMLSDYAQSSY